MAIQILHASDLEGGVEALDRAPNFAAITEALEIEAASNGDFSFFITSGDSYLPGPFFAAAADESVRDILNESYETLLGLNGFDIREGSGRIDIQIKNILGVDAATFGNHEFDLGTDVIPDIIATDIRDSDEDGELDQVRWLGAQFPYLSANLDFTGDGNLSDLFTDELLDSTEFQSAPGDLSPAELEAAANAPKLAPFTIIDQDQDAATTDDRIGVVGATTPLLASISSPGDTTVKNPGAGTNDMAALASILQPSIDALTAAGIDKIVLSTHLQQFSLEQELIGLLNDVDIVIAGGSDTLQADATDVIRPGDTVIQPYPFVTQDLNGNPAVIIGTPGQYSYVGRLVIDFDANGNIVLNSIDPTESGIFATTDAVVNDLWDGLGDPFADGTKGSEVAKLTDAVEDVVIAQDSNIFGSTSVYIEGRREFVRTESTNMGELTAKANLFVAQKFDSSVVISIKNGGGIRNPIGEIDSEGNLLPTQANPLSGKEEGEISQLDITNSLRFNNELTVLTLTVAQIVEVVEHAVSATEEGATPGQFPQIAGLKFSFDPTQPEGERVESLAIVDDEDRIVEVLVLDGEIVSRSNKTFKIVTLNFLAGGGDGYPFPEFDGTDRVDLVDAFGNTSTGVATFAEDGTEQDALAEYLAEFYSDEPFDEEETSAENDVVIQNLSIRNDVVVDIDVNVFFLTGTIGADVLIGGNLGDRLKGRGGDDDIHGLDGDDLIFGQRGDDRMDGGDGDDHCFGRAGDDRCIGRAGDDNLRGNKGDDILIGGAGDDLMLGFRDDDILRGGDGDDFMRGGLGDDVLAGQDGEDFMHGGVGDDILRGGDGDDEILGGRGDDILFGGDGDDFLWAQDGNDLLIGGLGDDLLLGGRADDVFVIADDGSVDTIQGFNLAGDDVIQFRGFDIEEITAVGVGSGVELQVVDLTIAILTNVTVEQVEGSLGLTPTMV
ncbi:MAG: 5'-nucleotidase C-terminal domain-containing protein [Elainellaceae cyanobacterium]